MHANGNTFGYIANTEPEKTTGYLVTVIGKIFSTHS